MRPNDYKTSLKKFWNENFYQDTETVCKKEKLFNFREVKFFFIFFKLGSISTFLYLPKIDKIVYGMTDGSIVILPAMEFLIKSLYRRRLNEKTSKFYKLSFILNC